MIRALACAASLAVIATSATAAAEVRFRFPGSDEHRGHFYVTAYRDHSSSELQDFACGSTTYGGHRGTDMGAGSFAGMDEGRDIVAAASGVVTFVHDGVFDRCTSGTCGGGGGFGNYVRIEHEDGKETYYGHLKKYSITVSVGDQVSCGQKLGEMGSSGNSTGPHLHFEPRVNNTSDDPFSGTCGGPVSWWVEQGEYQALPETTCQESGPSHPAFSMGAELVATGAADSPRSDALDVDQTAVARFTITASPEGSVARDVVVGLEAPAATTVLEWTVYDDHHDNDCGGALCPNDANDNPANPPRELPGGAFDLHLNALSPGETKVVELAIRADAETSGAPLRFWVKEVPGSYEKPSFDSEPQNIDGAQTFNGGDLKQELSITIGDAGGGGGGGSSPVDPNEPDASASLAGGCAATGASSGIAHVLALLFALGATRARRARQSPVA